MKVALFHGIGPLSALVRWQTRSEYSHAALVLNDGSLVESWHNGGVQHLTGFKRGLKGVDLFDVKDLTLGQSWGVEHFAKSQVGKKYDFTAVLRFVSRRKKASDDRWFCSELVFAALAFAGVNLFARTEAWEVSPGLLARSPLLIPAP